MRDFSLGVSITFSRFSDVNSSKLIRDIKQSGLNAIEIGLLNCAIGRMNIPGLAPFPTKKQINTIINYFSPKDNYLSVHAPYRISATSSDPKKLKYSKSNLSATFKIANWLEAHHITFHGGSFKQKHNNAHVQKVLKEWGEWFIEKGYTSKLAPEVGGKYNSFADFFTLVKIAGTIENCLITWDISHDFARGGNITTEEGILKRLEILDQIFTLNKDNRLPVHFSGMIVGKTGEKQHTLLDYGTGVPWKLVASVLKEQKYLEKVNMICESKVPKGEKILGNAISDATRMKEFLRSDELVKLYKGKPGHIDYYFK